MTEKLVFNSEKPSGAGKFQLASGFISTTTILFEKEGVTAVIQATGHIDFYDHEDRLLASAEVPTSEGGRKVYEDVCCKTEDDFIIIQFPIYEWIDNYPHCDGEYDRWDTRTIGHHTVTFYLKTGTATVES